MPFLNKKNMFHLNILWIISLEIYKKNVIYAFYIHFLKKDSLIKLLLTVWTIIQTDLEQFICNQFNEIINLNYVYTAGYN